MSRFLAHPTMALYWLEKRYAKKGARWTVRLHSYHFGVTSALRAAAKLKLEGVTRIFVAGSKRCIVQGSVNWRQS